MLQGSSVSPFQCSSISITSIMSSRSIAMAFREHLTYQFLLVCARIGRRSSTAPMQPRALARRASSGDRLWTCRRRCSGCTDPWKKADVVRLTMLTTMAMKTPVAVTAVIANMAAKPWSPGMAPEGKPDEHLPAEEDHHRRRTSTERRRGEMPSRSCSQGLLERRSAGEPAASRGDDR